MTDRARRLLVDARPIEHPTARRRGIGRYTTGILQGFAEVGTPVTALASNAAEAALIRPQVPGVDVQVWDPAIVRAHIGADTWYLATGLFLHPVSFDPIPSVITRAGIPVAGIMYDVIPYRYPDRYLVDPPARRMAELRKPLARTVDAVLAISRFAATTSVEELALDPARVRVVGAGVESRFERADRTLPRPADVPEGRYVVCVTGADEHKNTLGLIEAWGRARVSHQLVIVGGAREAVRCDWRRATEQASVTDRVDITGAVSDERLVRLLQYASLSIAPSFEDGFGLPVLEAAACGCAVITSDRGALPEVLDEPASCFDPADPAAVAEAIELAVIDDHHREILLAAGRRAVARRTWPYVAINALDAIDAAAVHRPGRHARPAVLLVYDAAMADTGSAVAAAIGALPGAPVVWEAVDVAGGAETSHPAALRSPAGAVGHFPKVHDFDRVVVLGEAAVPAAVPAAVRLLAPFDAHQIAALLPTV